MSDPVSGAQVPPPSAADLAGAIREASAATSVCTEAALKARFQGADLAPAFAALGEGFPDIAQVPGAGCPYWYSTNYMTESYARHLARVEDKDPLRLVAETVRDDSRIYPRPTSLSSFYDRPFRLTPNEVAGLLLRLGREAGTEDIKAHTATTGAVYLYSTTYLTEAHAQGLVQYYEVDRWNNP